jgi:hypothetical protein
VAARDRRQTEENDVFLAALAEVLQTMEVRA